MPFEIVRNDITKMKVDAIVNAANRSLLGGGGVDGAIHQAAGPKLLAECRRLGGCEPGEAKLTRGYRLPAKYVIHTVGPIWHGGDQGEAELLSACYRNALKLASEAGCETLAFPLISAGAYGYPKDQAMSIAIDAIGKFLFDHDMTVYLVVFGHTEFVTSKRLFRDVQEYIDDVYAASHVRKNVERSRETLWRRDEDAALQLDQQLGAAMSEDRAPKAAPRPAPSASAPDWEKMLRQTDEGFSSALLRLIDERGMTDAQCYKKANVDRKLFSKIRSNAAYKPSKPTVFAFAVALELSLPETQSLLRKAGFALSHSSKFDIILEYFIKTRNYNIYEINEILFQFDMPLLGSGVN
ncbi:MAG: O-acetyl-ADP-ribose deacetylase [Clostridia bacterium]|nr:O-acetyl-ADP-ribose deacetylase [Clostridia bacterium]